MAQPHRLETPFDEQAPNLARLRLSPAERIALRRQGFVAAERRGDGTVYFKLRFRFGGRQRVRRLGRDPEHGAQVRRELDRLQARRTFRRELARLLRAVRRALREAKRDSTDLLAQNGFVYHGYAIRRRRATRAPDLASGAASPVATKRRPPPEQGPAIERTRGTAVTEKAAAAETLKAPRRAPRQAPPAAGTRRGARLRNLCRGNAKRVSGSEKRRFRVLIPIASSSRGRGPPRAGHGEPGHGEPGLGEPGFVDSLAR